VALPILIARADHEGSTDETFLVRSPGVGVVDGIPGAGVHLNPAGAFMTMTILGRRHGVELPPRVQGMVVERFGPPGPVAVGFNQPLLRLSPATGPRAPETAGRAPGAAPAEGIAADLVPVRAPSEGVFYSRPSPDSAPYVEVGSPVETGTVVGLVEVMKCFNHIAYGGPDLPARGTVERILAADAAEVTFGQVLFLIRPA
jgi:acetyl-CoA carboxylase biotin carboxyl carrier protein